MKVYVLIFSTCYFSVLASGDIYEIWNAVNSAAKDFGDTMNIGVNAVGIEISKIPDTVNNAVDAAGNTVNSAAKDFVDTMNIGVNAVGIKISKIPNTVNNAAEDFGNTVNSAAKDFGYTVNNGVNAVGNEISKVPDTVNNAVDAAGNTVNSASKDFGTIVNNGVNAVGNEISKVPRLVNSVVCSDVLTGVLINFLIMCNPHAFITDTLDTEDIVMMESCKLVEVVSYGLPVLADLATAPVQIICSVWVEERLELYSHLKGIVVNKPATPVLSNIIFIDNNKLLYELAKMNDQYCNGDCNVNGYEFIESPSLSNSDNGRFKRSITSKVLKKVAEKLSKKSVKYIKSVRIVVRKNGVPKSITFRGLNETAGIRAETEFTKGILNIHRKKSLGFHQNVNSLIDLYIKYKTIPNTLTTKCLKYPPTSTDFMKIAWECWYRELLTKVKENI